MSVRVIAATVLALVAAPVLAQTEAPAASAAACAADPAPPPPELAAWASRAALAATGDVATAPPLTPGKAYDVALVATPSVTYPVAPRHAGAPESFGGVVKLAVASAGTYRVALGGGPWVDLVQNGAAITSGAHGHGPACTGIRKIVDFSLTPGTYFLTIAGNKDAKLGVLAARVP